MMKNIKIIIFHLCEIKIIYLEKINKLFVN